MACVREADEITAKLLKLGLETDKANYWSPAFASRARGMPGSRKKHYRYLGRLPITARNARGPAESGRLQSRPRDVWRWMVSPLSSPEPRRKRSTSLPRITKSRAVPHRRRRSATVYLSGTIPQRDILSALPPEKVGMLAPPLGSAVPVFSDNDPEAKCYRWRQVIAMLAAATIGFLSPSRISAAQLSPV